MNLLDNAMPRFFVHTVTSGIGDKIRDPHRVVDRLTNETVDEYTSKRAAQMHCKTLNVEHGKATTVRVAEQQGGGVVNGC